jgi:hypothetical protein
MGSGYYLNNLGVTFGSYNAATGRAGDFAFNHRFDKIFYEFGDTLPAGKALPYSVQFQFYLAPDAQIRAVNTAIVQRVDYKEQAQAYEIQAMPTENSDYYIVYDYVGGANLKPGDVIDSGQVIGHANGVVNNATWAPEVQVGLQSSNAGVAPWTYFDPAAVDGTRNELRNLLADWESFKGNSSIYDESSWYDVGAKGAHELALRDNPLLRAGTDGGDAINGSGGKDFVSSGAGRDSITGMAGEDELQGGGGGDVIYGNQGADWIRGEAGDDVLFGGQGNDVVVGGDGADAVYGNLGSDAVFGDGGSDLVFGGQGDDTLNGGAGNDVLMGGRGDDLLYGGAGADTFMAGGGADRIGDFSYVEGDRIILAAGASYAIGANAAGEAVVDLGGGVAITLAGIVPAAIGADWFLVV